jgi:hypothetical protein
LTSFPPKIVSEKSGLRVPHQTPYRLAPIIRESRKMLGLVLIALQPLGFGQYLFEMHHQHIELDRGDGGDLNRREISAVGEPAGTGSDGAWKSRGSKNRLIMAEPTLRAYPMSEAGDKGIRANSGERGKPRAPLERAQRWEG